MPYPSADTYPDASEHPSALEQAYERRQSFIRLVMFTPKPGLPPELDGSVAHGPTGGLYLDLGEIIAAGGIVTAEQGLIEELRRLDIFEEETL